MVKKSKNRYELIAGLMPVLFNDFFGVKSTDFDKVVANANGVQDILRTLLIREDKVNDSKTGSGILSTPSTSSEHN